MAKSPCFNTITRTDCPNRHEGCAAQCPNWAKYTEERDAEYAAKVKQKRLDAGAFEVTRRRVHKINKKHKK